MKRVFNLQVLSILVILAWLLPNVASTYIEPDELGVRRPWHVPDLRHRLPARSQPPLRSPAGDDTRGLAARPVALGVDVQRGR